MEDNVALDSNKQKKFNKSIKKLMQKKNTESNSVREEKVKAGRISKKKRKQRGLVYLAHIPHGFFEHEMTQYFKQFGVVTNARVIKSKRTGRSKGYAFVEFKEPTVAQIVAETMNNYLMGKRLIKASYIPPEKQRRASRKHWNSVNNPGNEMRIKIKKAHNENKDEKRELERARKMLSNINNTKQKLEKLGVNYDFFTPVDVPEQLLNDGKVKEEESHPEPNEITEKGETKKEISRKVKVKPDLKHEKTKHHKNQNTDKKDKLKPDKNMQKKHTLKGKGVQLLEEFMKVQQDSDNDSDSSLEFDSDDFEKIMQSDESDNEEIGASESASDESEKQCAVKKRKKTLITAVPEIQPKISSGRLELHTKAPQQHRKTRQPAQEVHVAAPKTPKFGKKNNQKSRNKQFKKK